MEANLSNEALRSPESRDKAETQACGTKILCPQEV
jgi:hypothetical protein